MRVLIIYEIDQDVEELERLESSLQDVGCFTLADDNHSYIWDKLENDGRFQPDFVLLLGIKNRPTSSYLVDLLNIEQQRWNSPSLIFLDPNQKHVYKLFPELKGQGVFIGKTIEECCEFFEL